MIVRRGRNKSKSKGKSPKCVGPCWRVCFEWNAAAAAPESGRSRLRLATTFDLYSFDFVFWRHYECTDQLGFQLGRYCSQRTCVYVSPHKPARLVSGLPAGLPALLLL